MRQEEVIGRHFGMFYLPEDREAGMPARSLATAREKGKFEAEGWRLRKDGRKFLASVVIDAIYEARPVDRLRQDHARHYRTRMKAADALKESERHFRLLVKRVTDYALYMLDPNGIVTNWNAAGNASRATRPRKSSASTFHASILRQIKRQAGRPVPCSSHWRMVVTKKKAGASARMARSFGQALSSIPFATMTTRLLGFAKITRDISERREAQLHLEKVQRQLAESQKLDALGQLTGGVAHDFNNLLMVITGHIHTLKKIAGNDAKSLRAVQAIETATQRGASLTRQLLTFARRQSVNPQTIDLMDSIHSVWEVLHTGLGGAVQLRIDLDDDIWPVTVDRAELETALVNLIINARDAMPSGGSVTVRASNVHIDDGIRKGDHVAIEVKDTGVGIPPDVIAKVFDPFFTTKPDWQRYRSGALAGARLRPSSRWHGRCGQRAGKRHDVHHLSAARAIGSCADRARSTLDRQWHRVAGRR